MNNLILIVNSFGILYISYLAKKYIDKKEEELDFAFEEITMLKSLHRKNREAIRNIIRKLPFNGEEWMREFIFEDIQDECDKRFNMDNNNEEDELDLKTELTEESKKEMREKLDIFQEAFEKSLIGVGLVLDKQNHN